MCWSRNQFLLGSNSGSGAIYKSANGDTWSRVSGWNGGVTRMLSIGGVSYAMGSLFGTPFLKRSFDGDSWTDITPQGSPTLTDMTWNDEVLILLDSNNYFLKGSNLKYEFFRWAASTGSVAENAGSASFDVWRLGPATSASSVDFETLAGSAADGLDYVGSSGTLTFGAGETVKTVQIHILDDSLIENTETFTINLKTPSNNAALTAPFALAASIVDDEPRPVFQFQSGSYSVAENAGFVDINVIRSWDVSSPTTVAFSTQAGTAADGLDFQGAAGILAFASGETQHTIRLAIINNSSFAWSPTFTVSLSNPASGSSLGQPTVATVSIVNDDPAPAALIVLEALYGANGTQADVRSYVTANILNNTVRMTASNSTLGGDPLFGVGKSLYVRYQSAAGHFSATVTEGSQLRIPDPGAQRLPMDFSQWATTKFSAAEQLDPMISGETADPNHNGIPNLLEYALNMDPKGAWSTGLPRGGVVSLAGGTHLSLTFNVNPDAQNLSYIVEVSGDLHTWSSGMDYTEQQSPSGSNPVVVFDKVPADSSSRRFIRLKVVRN